MIARGLVVAACGAIAACVSIPAFRGTDGGSGSGDGGTPGIPTYSIHFGSGHGHYPDDLQIDGIPMLASSASSCHDETLVGFQNYPAFREDASSGSDGSFVEDLPLVSVDPLDIRQVTMRWSQAHVTCAGDREMTVRSTFTMFPDGVISRFDQVEQGSGTAGPLAPSTLCSCDNDTPDLWRVFSSTTLVDVTKVELPNGNGLIPDGTRGGVAGEAIMCARNLTGQQLAFAWPNDLTRVRKVDARATAFMLDLVPPAATQEGIASTFRRTLMLVGGAGSNCHDLNTQIASLGGDPQLTMMAGVSGTTFGRADVDGIYGGAQLDGSVGFPIVGGATILLSTPDTIAPGWSLRVHYVSGGRPDHYDTGTLAAADVHQQLTATDTIFWFRVGLAAGTQITLTPQ